MGRRKDKSRVSLTDAGKTILRGTVFIALAALVVPAFGALSAFVAVLLVSLIVGYFVRPRIRISGNLPDRVVARQTTTLTFKLRNVARLPAYNLDVQLEGLSEKIEQLGSSDIIPHLGSGETVEVNITIRPLRRGLYRICKPVLRSCFPFNLFSFATDNDRRETLVVLPVFSRLQMPVRHLGRYVSAGGTKFAGTAGTFPEYAGNRPFVPGDSPRSIDSRAWARLAAPATKEYHDDYDNHAALVLDTDVPENLRRTKSGDIREFEAAVSLCASAAFTISNQCLVDMLVAGPDLHSFDGEPRTVRLHKIHEILAGVEPQDSRNPRDGLPLIADRFYAVSEVIFVLLNWNEAYEQLMEKAAGIGCHTTVFVIDGSERMDHIPNASNRLGNVLFISPDEILSGQVRRL
jgi:uncharacterized protein (DUF58 family)